MYSEAYDRRRSVDLDFIEKVNCVEINELRKYDSSGCYTVARAVEYAMHNVTTSY